MRQRRDDVGRQQRENARRSAYIAATEAGLPVLLWHTTQPEMPYAYTAMMSTRPPVADGYRATPVETVFPGCRQHDATFCPTCW